MYSALTVLLLVIRLYLLASTSTRGCTSETRVQLSFISLLDIILLIILLVNNNNEIQLCSNYYIVKYNDEQPCLNTWNKQIPIYSYNKVLEWQSWLFVSPSLLSTYFNYVSWHKGTQQHNECTPHYAHTIPKYTV